MRRSERLVNVLVVPADLASGVGRIGRSGWGSVALRTDRDQGMPSAMVSARLTSKIALAESEPR